MTARGPRAGPWALPRQLHRTRTNRLVRFSWGLDISRRHPALAQKEPHPSQLGALPSRSPQNVVEVAHVGSTRNYVHFLTVALGSASELWYLLGLAGRLEFIAGPIVTGLDKKCHRLLRSLQRLINSLAEEPWSPKPEVRSLNARVGENCATRG